MIIVYFGVFVFGLFLLIRPDYFVKRKYKKENKSEEEINPKDYRFFRLFGVVLMILMAAALAIDLLR